MRGSRVALALTLCVANVAGDGRYALKLEKKTSPAMSVLNGRGNGFTPCNYTFNPAWIPASEGSGGRTGLLVRVAKCPGAFGGDGDHIMMAYCEPDGTCGDLEPQLFSFEDEAQDPRVVFDESTGYYNLWYYASGQDQKQVYYRRTRTPFNASSWERIGDPQPWHRNGCAFPEGSTGSSRYLVVGEAPPLKGLGIVRSDDGFKSYTMLNETFIEASGKDDKREPEIVVEASTPVVQLKTGDFLHLYSAGTPGWVANGNYTAGWVIIDGKDPTRIIQRSEEHVLIASLPFEGVDAGNYPVQRERTTFVTSIVPIAQGEGSETFRLWWGAADANVATGILTVSYSRD